MWQSKIDEGALRSKGVKYVNWGIASQTTDLIVDENKCCDPLDVKKALQRVVTIPNSAQAMIILITTDRLL